MVRVNERQNLGKQSTGLDPFLDKDGIIRVGGRLDNCFKSNNCKHPILLPNDGKVTTLIIQHHGKMAAHGGRFMTLTLFVMGYLDSAPPLPLCSLD